jgi:hypothetical protein
VPLAAQDVMSTIDFASFKQSRQRQYMSRFRVRLDNFIKTRVPLDCGSEMIRLASKQNFPSIGSQELVWDYSEVRESLLASIEANLASGIYADLQKQFWFDAAYVSREMVAERCLSYLILGPIALAAE